MTRFPMTNNPILGGGFEYDSPEELLKILCTWAVEAVSDIPYYAPYFPETLAVIYSIWRIVETKQAKWEVTSEHPDFDWLRVSSNKTVMGGFEYRLLSVEAWLKDPEGYESDNYVSILMSETGVFLSNRWYGNYTYHYYDFEAALKPILERWYADAY